MSENERVWPGTQSWGTDVFVEERVERPVSASASLAGAALGFLALVLPLFLLVLLRGNPVALLTYALTIWGWRHFVRRQRREFEYAFTNGSLDVDVIFNKEWRRRVATVEFPQQVVSMAPVSGPVPAGSAVVDATGPRTGTVYSLVFRGDRGERHLLLEPSEHLVQLCRRRAPQQVRVA
jgi:hypothetical protein